MASEAEREREQSKLGRTGTGNRSDESDKPGPYGADLAALLGATLAVLLTLTGSPGAWGPLSTIIGLLLLIILLAFFWRRRLSLKRSWSWELFFVGVALSVVVGFVTAITLAQPIQWRLFRDDTGYSDCRPVAVAQAAVAVRDLSDADNSKASAQTLHKLISAALDRGSANPPDVNDLTLTKAFYDAYDDAVGNCRANDTFKSLWWIGVPALLLTLAWWIWSFIVRFARALVPASIGDSASEEAERDRDM